MKKRTIGYTNDLTDMFIKARAKAAAPDGSDAQAKSRFLVRKGLLQGVTQSETLLPSSTKASSSDDSLELKTQSANSLLGANHLPPAYVDIQEEIEADLSEISQLCKSFEKNLTLCVCFNRD